MIAQIVTGIPQRLTRRERFFNHFSSITTPTHIGRGMESFSRLTNRYRALRVLTICLSGGVLGGALSERAAAQEMLPTIPEVMADVTDTEVFITGAFGIGSRTPETDFWVILPDGTELPVILQLDEPVGVTFQGCHYSPGHGGTPCAFKGYGYLVWEGATLQAVLTGIEELFPSEVSE